MGSAERKKIVVVLALLFCASSYGAETKSSLLVDESAIRRLRAQITSLQSELTDSKSRQSNSRSQLQKIKKLLDLQRREIQLSEKRINQLNSSLDELSRRRIEVAGRIEQQKRFIRKRLTELYKLVGADQFGDPLRFVEAVHFDVFAQKSYFLKKVLSRDIRDVNKLETDVQEALALELKILEERNKLDYYVFELKDKAAELTVNQQIHHEILKTNRVNHLEALKRIRALRESERELDQVLSDFQKKEATSLASTLASLKGKLELPVKGALISQFGRSFNPKTNLLTFQKGIAIEAEVGSDVEVVYDGKVVYQGPLKNYGSIVIVEHAGQYFSLYGQLGRTLVKEGDSLRRGDKIGSTSDEPFYFEIREKNVAVNPAKWLDDQSLAFSKKSGGTNVVQ